MLKAGPGKHEAPLCLDLLQALNGQYHIVYPRPFLSSDHRSMQLMRNPGSGKRQQVVCWEVLAPQLDRTRQATHGVQGAEYRAAGRTQTQGPWPSWWSAFPTSRREITRR